MSDVQESKAPAPVIPNNDKHLNNLYSLRQAVKSNPLNPESEPRLEPIQDLFSRIRNSNGEEDPSSETLSQDKLVSKAAEVLAAGSQIEIPDTDPFQNQTRKRLLNIRHENERLKIEAVLNLALSDPSSQNLRELEQILNTHLVSQPYQLKPVNLEKILIHHPNPEQTEFSPYQVNPVNFNRLVIELGFGMSNNFDDIENNIGVMDKYFKQLSRSLDLNRQSKIIARLNTLPPEIINELPIGTISGLFNPDSVSSLEEIQSSLGAVEGLIDSLSPENRAKIIPIISALEDRLKIEAQRNTGQKPVDLTDAEGNLRNELLTEVQKLELQVRSELVELVGVLANIEFDFTKTTPTELVNSLVEELKASKDNQELIKHLEMFKDDPQAEKILARIFYQIKAEGLAEGEKLDLSEEWQQVAENNEIDFSNLDEEILDPSLFMELASAVKQRMSDLKEAGQDKIKDMSSLVLDVMKKVKPETFKRLLAKPAKALLVALVITGVVMLVGGFVAVQASGQSR